MTSQTLFNVKCSVCIILYKDIPHLSFLPKACCIKPTSYLKRAPLDGELREHVYQRSEVDFCLQASRDYVGMAVEDGQLKCVYNLGEREAELQVDQILTKSETQEAVMDRVKFQRYKPDRLPLFVNLTYTH